MTHTYDITGMTCTSCGDKVSNALKQIDGIKDVSVDWEGGKAVIEMSKHITTQMLAEALKPYPKFTITDSRPVTPYSEDINPKSWFTLYKPLLIIVAYISAVSAIISRLHSGFDPMLAMRVFMAGFFLSFSFFKILDLKGFAESYATYDIIARRLPHWGYVYAFMELALGIAYTIDLAPLLTNIATAIIMSVSMIGVLQSVLDKKKIKCACLGVVFDLPMSTVTIIEDGAMILMSLASTAILIF